MSAEHTKGHSEDPWNEFSDVLADYVHSGGTFPGEHGILPQLYTALGALRDAPTWHCLALPSPFHAAQQVYQTLGGSEAQEERRTAAPICILQRAHPFSGGCTSRRRADGARAASAT